MNSQPISRREERIHAPFNTQKFNIEFDFTSFKPKKTVA